MTLTEKKKFFAVSIFLSKSKYIERGEKKKLYFKDFHVGITSGGEGSGLPIWTLPPCELNKW